MDNFAYFAYGSNMLTERLRKRCRSARPIGIASAKGYSVVFFKQSIDNSGKATLRKVTEEGRQAYGILFDIKIGDLTNLDQAEGKGNGYDRIDKFSVNCLADGKLIQAKTYIAPVEYIDTGLKPYDWYQALVIQGALQHELPDSYIESLRDITSIIDPNLSRTSREQAVEVLAQTGVQDLTQIL